MPKKNSKKKDSRKRGILLIGNPKNYNNIDFPYLGSLSSFFLGFFSGFSLFSLTFLCPNAPTSFSSNTFLLFYSSSSVSTRFCFSNSTTFYSGNIFFLYYSLSLYFLSRPTTASPPFYFSSSTFTHFCFGNFV